MDQIIALVKEIKLKFLEDIDIQKLTVLFELLLRINKEHNLLVEVKLDDDGIYNWATHEDNRWHAVCGDEIEYKTYEAALEAGILGTLEYIKHVSNK